MADEDFKDLSRRAASDKVFRDKAFNIAKNSKYDGCQSDLVSMVYVYIYIYIYIYLIKSLLKVVVLIMKLNKMCN